MSENYSEQSKHEEGEDLHKVINPCILSTSVLHSRTQRLRDDSTDFAQCSTEAMSCRTISGREYLARDDKRGCVGAEVLEKVGETDESKKSASRDVVITKSNDAK